MMTKPTVGASSGVLLFMAAAAIAGQTPSSEALSLYNDGVPALRRSCLRGGLRYGGQRSSIHPRPSASRQFR
jgi:hypothetical protein